MIRSKGKILAALLALPCIGGLCALPIVNSLNSKTVSIKSQNNIKNSATEDNDLCDPFGSMKDTISKYFIPAYTSSSNEFIQNDGFPALIDKSGTKSITFSQLFIDETIANAIAKQANLEANNEVLDISTHKNHLAEIDTLNLSSILYSSSTSSLSAEQLLIAVFLNPHLYELPNEYEKTYSIVETIDLTGNNLVAIPKGTFVKIFENVKSTSSISVNLESNAISIINKEQFYKDNKPKNITLNIKSNRVTNTKDLKDLEAAGFNIEGKDVQKTLNFFFKYNNKNSNFFYDFIKDTYPQNNLWSSLLIKNDILGDIVELSNDLNLYTHKVPEKTPEDVISIDGNDWTGKFSISFANESGEAKYDFTDTNYFNANAYPLIFYIFILLSGACFLYSRAKKVINKK